MTTSSSMSVKPQVTWRFLDNQQDLPGEQ